MHNELALAARDPQAARDHELPQSLKADVQVVKFGKLFAR
jgi:hypothetical protein